MSDAPYPHSPLLMTPSCRELQKRGLGKDPFSVLLLGPHPSSVGVCSIGGFLPSLTLPLPPLQAGWWWWRFRFALLSFLSAYCCFNDESCRR